MTAVQIKPKAQRFFSGKDSPNTKTLRKNSMVGLINCRKPVVERGRSFAPLEKARSGIAVTIPVEARIAHWTGEKDRTPEDSGKWEKSRTSPAGMACPDPPKRLVRRDYGNGCEIILVKSQAISLQVTVLSGMRCRNIVSISSKNFADLRPWLSCLSSTV
jgi:hypothetical protein